MGRRGLYVLKSIQQRNMVNFIYCIDFNWLYSKYLVCIVLQIIHIQKRKDCRSRDNKKKSISNGNMFVYGTSNILSLSVYGVWFNIVRLVHRTMHRV